MTVAPTSVDTTPNRQASGLHLLTTGPAPTDAQSSCAGCQPFVIQPTPEAFSRRSPAGSPLLPTAQSRRVEPEMHRRLVGTFAAEATPCAMSLSDPLRPHSVTTSQVVTATQQGCACRHVLPIDHGSGVAHGSSVGGHFLPTQSIFLALTKVGPAGSGAHTTRGNQ